MKRRAVLGVALVTLTGGIGGYLLGVSVPDRDAPTPPVNISVIYDQHGEAIDVDLTDSNGEYVPAGSIAESWPDENTDAEETP